MCLPGEQPISARPGGDWRLALATVALQTAAVMAKWASMEELAETSRSRLIPDETVQKFLISTTSRLIADFEAGRAAIQHAFPNFRSKSARLRMAEGPISRSGFVLAFETEPYQKAPGVIIPTYDHVADAVCTCLAVLYGKRFDNHGALEWDGRHCLPDLTAFGAVSLPDMPWNTHAPRVDVGISLDLREFKRILPLLDHKLHDQTQILAFSGAARFYLRALQAAEQDPEVAYLHLITAGEILANATHHNAEALLDDATKGALGRIEAEMCGGRKVANLFRGRLRQVKRRFVAAFADIVDPAFFARTESREEFAAMKPESFWLSQLWAYPGPAATNRPRRAPRRRARPGGHRRRRRTAPSTGASTAA